MKKNISINIGGIIFHIEEDGYDRLKNYLDSINRYFSSFEDSKEIIDDIENRIAEILLGKLSDGKQVIVIEDIDELVTTMGTVADFEAAIDTDTDGPATGHTQQENRTESTTEAGGAAPKRLFRDSKHRLLGGVASGLAHYFNIDALWVRLLFLALLFNLLLAPVSGATLLAYIILWIVLPPNDGLEEDKDIKKLFRSSEGRVMGGVASGIAAYFGTDTAVIRLLFVLSIFLGGAGIILYIIMWIITPEARTITEKMQMQGEPVTLSNIESNVKKSLNVQEGEENLLVKILLFPFRLIAIVINGLAEILGPFMKFLVEALRIVFGVVVMIIGVALVFSFIILLAVLLGIGGIWGHYTYIDDLPIQLLADTFNGMAAGSVFLILFIPAVAISLLGISIIARRSIGNSYLGWAMLGLWILGLIGALFVFPTFAHDFRV
ncbi:MAG: PspC domain-containing protein, partial [Cyclobacteriaceae bacterium]|nr:PspC domain-containing protein [Cyclobacteriaceae bacterium]